MGNLKNWMAFYQYNLSNKKLDLLFPLSSLPRLFLNLSGIGPPIRTFLFIQKELTHAENLVHYGRFKRFRS